MKSQEPYKAWTVASIIVLVVGLLLIHAICAIQGLSAQRYGGPDAKHQYMAEHWDELNLLEVFQQIGAP